MNEINEIVDNSEDGKFYMIRAFKNLGVNMMPLVNFWPFMHGLKKTAHKDKLSAIQILRGINVTQGLAEEKKAIELLIEIEFIYK